MSEHNDAGMKPAAVATVFALATGFLTACDKSPSGPGPLGEIPPYIVNVEILGPQVIAPGETAELRLLAQLSDRSTRDVTNEARWRLDSREAISISTSGLMTGLKPGEARVTGAFEGRQGSTDVLVLPGGTYRLMGTVTDAAGPSEVVAGARVEVTTGIGAGIFAETDVSGHYRLYGLSGETGLRLTKDGYEPAARTVVVAGHKAVHNLALWPVAARVRVSGNYTLTITVAEECGTGLGEGRLPEEAGRVRTYEVAVQQTEWRLTIKVSNPTTNYSLFYGKVEPGRVLFDLAWYDDSGVPEPSIIEQLPSSNFLAVRGKANTTGSADRLEGTLQGDLGVFANHQHAWGRAIASCPSKNHQFVLSR